MGDLKKSDIIIVPNRTYPIHFGVIVNDGAIEFAVRMNSNNCGVVFYTLKDKLTIQFTDNCKLGNVYSGIIKGIDIDSIVGYNFSEDDKEFVDPYAKCVVGNEIFAAALDCDELNSRSAALISRDFDWEDDISPKIPYNEAILYLLHVRGFTMDSSSRVKAKGTFRGIVEKISYIKGLGVTSLELMPCYEFEEVDVFDESLKMEYALKYFRDKMDDKSIQKSHKKLNTWGYKEAHYFAPKRSYSYDKDCVYEMKDMIKKLHKEGIEVIMQFYFDSKLPYKCMYDILAYWIVEFHIDGVHIMGENLPINFIAKEALFSDTKILYDFFNQDDINHENNLATYNSKFMNCARRYLKGDQDSLASFIGSMKKESNFVDNIAFISNYNEFTLYDLVSYDSKHNEDNGEENRDGNNYNQSWNHGVEGDTKKRSIINLRKKQMKNIMTYLLLGQSTPMILAGDEFGNTKRGNNNAYCHDNEYLWLNWKLLKKNEKINTYIKDLIKFRKSHSIFYPVNMYKGMDVLGCGYPDISYHGEEIWKPNFENYSRMIGVFYSGCYGEMLDGVKQSDYYVIYNSHWVLHNCALPHLKKGFKWKKIIDTNCMNELEDFELENQNRIVVEERSIVVLECIEDKKK